MSFDEVIDRRRTNSLKWSRYGKDVLPLWVADMDFVSPEPVRQVLRAAIDHGIFGYELPTKKLAESVARRMQELYRWSISPEAVVAVPGIVAGFHAAARAVCRGGEGVLVQPPVYHPFLKVPAHTHTTLQTAPLVQVNEQHKVSYEIDWTAFKAGFGSQHARTAMFLLCHPHNPTGQVYSGKELKRMAEICLAQGTIICSDEIHSELLLGGSKHVPLASISREIEARSITLLSASKTFNVVGLFCGFAIIPDRKLRTAYRRVLEQTALHVNSLGLIAAAEAFSGSCEGWLRDLRCYLTANRDYLVQFVADQLPGVRVTVPDATYLAWLDFSELVKGGIIGEEPYQFLLEKAKVGLNPGAEFGPGGEGFVRLNFGCPRATLAGALERIRRALQPGQRSRGRNKRVR